jgi:hypothetical protein
MKYLLRVLTYSKNSNRLIIGIIGLWLTTLIHHLYGAYVYGTLWRVIAPLIIFPVILFLTLLLFNNVIETQVYYKKVFFVFVVLLFWIIPIGFIEGGYGHLLKNILYFINTSVELMHRLFPPEFGKTKFFESPNNYFFEISGIVQFFAGLYTLCFLVKFWRSI